jgi:hypothetical protein
MNIFTLRFTDISLQMAAPNTVSDIWDSEYLQPEVVDFCIAELQMRFEGEFDDTQSWLQLSDDQELKDFYVDATPIDLSWYLAIDCCDVYTYLLGTVAMAKWPERNWKVVYFPNHWVLMDESRVYDVLAYHLDKAGLHSHEYTLENRFMVESIPNLRIMIEEAMSLNLLVPTRPESA